MMTANIADAMTAIGDLIARTSNPTRLLGQIGEYSQQEVQARIRHDKEEPDGASWAPWRPSTRRQRIAKGNAGQGLLWDSGVLLQSVRWRADLLGVEIGPEMDSLYPVYLQVGTQNMAARPYLGWSEQDMAHIQELTVRYLDIPGGTHA